MPLVGKRTKRLGELPQAGDVDRELSPPTGDHLSFGADPITEVGVGQHRLGLVGQVGLLHEQLDRPGHVLEGGKREFAVATDAGQAPGHPDHLPRPDIGVQSHVAFAQLPGGGGPIESGGVGVDPKGDERLALPPALFDQCF